MVSIWMLLAAAGLMGVSGLPSLLFPRRSSTGAWASALLNLAGSCLGGVALVAYVMGAAGEQEVRCSWALPMGTVTLGLDALSLLFLIPMLLVSGLGSIYGLEYWAPASHPGNGRKLRVFWGLMTAGMMLVVLARDAVGFLVAWEVMAIAAYFLVATEDTRPRARRAGWHYLVATHVGTLCLFAMFALLRVVHGSFELWLTASPETPAGLLTGVFVLGMVGFGIKAGIMPLHVWLPNAHANAPSHVSAFLSGVLLKAGVYGIVRLTTVLPHPPAWWGWVILSAGAVSAVLGIAFAASQHDFKRVLAYSSVDNIGIIMIGLGLAVLGRGADRPEWIALGLGGALLHVLNHSLFKPLLFMGAGAVLHATHTRSIDRLGGLGRRMPRTYVMFVIGALAMCGLPPLNGFASELLIYIGLLQPVARGAAGPAIWAALAAPALAMVGAMAIATCAKLVGVMFGGQPRARCAQHAHDPGMLMLVPMALLAGSCVLLGLVPQVVLGLVDRAITAWSPLSPAPREAMRSVLPWAWVSVLGVSLLGATLVLTLVFLACRRRRPCDAAPTWDCGYARPSPRMQYTGSSFTQMLTGLFGWALFTTRRLPALRGLFARTSVFESQTPDTVLDRIIMPLSAAARRVATRARVVQMGSVQTYLLYVLGALLALGLVSWL